MVALSRFHDRKFDVVVAHGTIGELCTDADRVGAITQLWEYVADDGVLVITERGSR